MSGQVPLVIPNTGGRGVQAERVTEAGPLTAPFPWYGGKSRWADRINERLGTVGVYGEPCAGSFAVGLRRAPSPREIMCDTDHLLINVWRSMRGDPDATAWYAANPTFHADLAARQPWLIAWRREYGWRVTEDPDWYDPKAAGWWCWGASNWIGGGWCMEDPRRTPPQIPFLSGAQGVQAQRVADKVPNVGDKHGGRAGVQAQRCDDKRPRVQSDTGDGIGVQAQRGGIRDSRPQCGSTGYQGVQPQGSNGGDGDIFDGTRWQPWFRALARRLERVVILNRGWESAVTPSMLQHTPSGPKPVVGLFFDPPYLTRDGNRDAAIYHGDEHADQVAEATYAWCVEHGEKYRIAYACRAGDFDVPEGWTAETDSFAGVRDSARRAKHRDMVLFSPACVGQQELGF